MNCGTKLPDYARFCFNCGAKVPEGLDDWAAADEGQAPVAGPQDEPLTDIPGSHFTLLGKYEVELPRATAIYNQLWAPFNREGTRIALLARYEIRKHLKEHAVENPVEFSGQVFQYCMTVCNPLFEKAVELLIDRGIDYVTKKDLWDRLDDSATSTDLVKAMLADKAAIEDYEKDLAVERQADKASWRGGGFGITGAITGTIKASMMNTAQDALSALGRSITGNSYSDRLERFIQDRSAKRNYPAMARDFINSVCRFDLFNEVYQLLAEEGRVPKVSFETSKADSRRKNLLERYASGKLEKEEVLKGLCSCLEITGETQSVYEALLELEPSAARDVFHMAASEGEELELAKSVWQTYEIDKKVGQDFHFPDWMPNFLSRPFSVVAGPAMLLALLIELRDLPQMFRKEGTAPMYIALTAGTYWIPADANDVSFWGMDREVELTLDHPGDTDWMGHGVHFHLVQFRGNAAAWSKELREKKLQEAEALLGARDKARALSAFLLAAEMGSAEAAWQAGILQAKDGQQEEAQWSSVEAAVLGKKEAAWVLYQYLKKKQNEQCAAYRRLAAKDAQALVDAGKYDEALAWYETLVAEGDGTACLYLGQMAEQGKGMEKDEAKAMDWYEKAKAYGCEEAGQALGALAFAWGQALEEKAKAETGPQARTDWQQAWHDYQRALAEDYPGAAEKIKALGLQLGKEMEAKGQDAEALAYYQAALDLGSQDALLQAARLSVDPQSETFDFTEAWQLYQKAAQNAEDADAVSDEWNSRKALVPLDVRVDCLRGVVKDKMANAAYYYWGDKLSNPLDNAMKSYGARAGVQRAQVVLLCDSTHSLFWGKGEEGFLITEDGQLICSMGLHVSLDQVGPVEYDDQELIATAFGTVLARFKSESDEDGDFCDLLNDIVLLPHPKQQDEAPDQPTAGPAQQPEPQHAAASGVSFCPQCGAPAEPGTRFCGQCGTPLTSARTKS